MLMIINTINEILIFIDTIKSSKLTQEQISQIQNIVQRELNIEVSNISISNK